MPQIREQIAMVHLPPSKTLKYLFHVRKTKGYYTNLFTLSAALPSQYGSGNTDRKERIFSLVESVRSFFMSYGLSTDSPWTVRRTVTECSYFHLPFSKIFAIFNRAFSFAQESTQTQL